MRSTEAKRRSSLKGRAGGQYP